MATPSPKKITRLLVAWGDGDEAALEELTPLVYQQLHRLAYHYLRHEQPGHTLQTSALVNEAYLRLVDWKNVRWQSRAHFFGVSAQLMRRILVDFARSRRYEKRGGGVPALALEEAALISGERRPGRARRGAGLTLATRRPAEQSCRAAFLRRLNC